MPCSALCIDFRGTLIALAEFIRQDFGDESELADHGKIRRRAVFREIILR